MAHLLPGFQERLRLPAAFAQKFGGASPPSLGLLETTGGQPLHRVDTFLDGQWDLFLTRGWDSFVREYALHGGWILRFRYRRRPKVLRIGVFDGTLCRRLYHADSSSEEEVLVKQELESD